ncbi:unnamed protein product [Lupinus luteus]|uniref:Uncharacterized protein n=1 Tax=Lupinus luteus TaxID=3873 RepID=A0AAV1XLL0_LUPLU
MKDVEDKTCSKSSSANVGSELNSLEKTSIENVEVIVNPPENHSSIEARINTLSNSQALGQGEYIPLNNSASTSNATTVHVIEQSHPGFVAADSETKELHNELKELKIDSPETMVTDDVYMDNSAFSLASDATADVTEESNQGIIAANSEPGTLQDILKMEQVDDSNVSVGSDADNQMRLFASSHGTEKLKNEVDSPQTKVTDVAFGAVDSPTFAKQMAARKSLIDTAAPFESVKEAVSKFGGIVDWKAHRMETVEKSKIVEQELGKVQEEIPVYRKGSEASEQAKVEVIQELDSTRRLIEELKLNLERAKTEEHQARQDSELAKLRVEEMEQGIAENSSIAVKAQLEVAKARYTEAITELTSVREELDTLRKEYASSVVEKDGAIGKAEEVVTASKQVEKTVKDLTIELVSTKESLETAHAEHMEAEEQRIGTVMARDQDSLNWQKELKHAEEEVKILKHKIESAKDLKSKLDKASALLVDLKAELSSYMESKSEGDEEGFSKREPEKKTHNEIQAAVASAKKELEEVKINIEKGTSEVNHLMVAATSLKSELEQEKSDLASIRQREGMASITVASLEAELDNTRSEIALAQKKEKQGQEKLVQFPKKLQQAAEEANRANLLAQAAREVLWKVKEEADQAKAGASTMRSRLLATQKEIESSRASERLTITSIKALQASEFSRRNNDFGTSTSMTLSSDDYYQLSKQAHEAEEHANMKVAAANSEIEIAKESELKTLDKLNYVNREMAERRESLKVANDKAEKAREGKLAVEEELRKWRSEHEKRRKAGELGQGIVNQNKNKKASVDDRSKEAKNLDQSQNAAYPVQHLSSPKAYVHANSNATVKKKKKKKSLFPRILMFFSRRKAHSTH